MGEDSVTAMRKNDRKPSVIIRGRVRLLRGLVFGLVSAAAFGCGDGDATGPNASPAPVPTPESALVFLRPAPDAPPLLTTDTTVIATRGESLDVRLFYAPDPGSGEAVGERFLRFRLEDASLERYPATHPMGGAPFTLDDTVSIRITVDTSRLQVDLEPTGLRFSAEAPAELELRYAEADRDFDEDGVEDPPEVEEQIDLWRQEKPGDPWFRIGELKDFDLDKIEARLLGFSRYALAI